jgi:isocitrate dehydrogenase kinase/phosphatase
MPVAPTDEAELAPEPWFALGPNDVFPAEFSTFLGVKGDIRAAFDTHHRDLFEHRWWRSMQDRVEAGELIEIYPYEGRARLGDV